MKSSGNYLLICRSSTIVIGDKLYYTYRMKRRRPKSTPQGGSSHINADDLYIELRQLKMTFLDSEKKTINGLITNIEVLVADNKIVSC